MYGQGNYPPQYRHGTPAPPFPFQAPPPAAPPPPFQQAQTGVPPPPPPPFQQAPTGVPPPPPQQGPLHQAANQIPQVPPPSTVYHHGLGASQPVHHPPPGMVNVAQPYMHLNPPSSSNYGNAPAAHPYASQIQAGAPYPAPMGNQSVHHIPPPPLPPPGGLPPTGVPSQGQSLYRIPPPPPPGIQHVPTPPPPPPSSFVTVTPAPFMPFVHGSVNEAHPPSLPPPPPPPPPSSPPPLPSPPPPPSSQGEELSIADSEEVLDHRAMKEYGLHKTVDGSGDATLLTGSIPMHSGHQNDNEEIESFANKEEHLAPVSPPFPRPTDEVVRSIEALCKFMANVGPHFENLARTKEASNPRFSFLFGGEPGSAAAIGYEYFQWMKRKYQLEVGTSNHPKQIMSYQQPSESQSPIDKRKASPAESDMDMDDDAGQPERSQGSAELNKETGEEAVSQYVIEVQSNAPSNVALEGMPEMSVLRCPPSSESAFLNLGKHDGDEFTEHHISAASPEASTGTLAGNVQQSIGSSFKDAMSVDVLSSHSDGTNVEVPRVFVKDGSPFRHIQGYASDDSGEDDKKELIIRGSLGRVIPSGSLDASQEHERAELHSALDSKGVTVAEESSHLHIESAEVHPQHMLTGVVGSSPASHDEASHATSYPGLFPSVGSVDEFGSHQKDDQPLDGRKRTSEASCHGDIAEGEKVSFRQQMEEFCEEKYATKDSILKVDEFGRMIREGASSSDSGELPYERHDRRGRSRSRSRSPQHSRKRSRSPWRWRGRRSPSQSWSPKRQSRSKSPPVLRRMGERPRRNHAQPPECIHFIRGRCYRGASCWFLHSDSGRHRNRSQDHQDMSHDSDKYVHSDVSQGAKSLVKETAAVQREGLLPEEETQDLQGGIALPSDSMKDDVLVIGGRSGSTQHDAKYLISDEQILSVNVGEVKQEPGSHEINQFQESHDAELKEEAPDACLMESETAQKPLGDGHPLADASLGEQTSLIPERQHLPGEGHPRQPSPAEDPADQPQLSFPVPSPQSEPQNVSSSQHLHTGPSMPQLSPPQPMQSSNPIMSQLSPPQPMQSSSPIMSQVSPPQPMQSSNPIIFQLSPPQPMQSSNPLSQLSPPQPMQSSNLQSQVPTAPLFTSEIPVTESYPRPSLTNQSFPDQVPGVRHFTPQPFAGGDFNVHLSQTQPPPLQGPPPHFASFPQTELRPSQGLAHYPSYAPQPPSENWVQTSRTNFLLQPSLPDMCPPNRPSLSGNYHSLNAPPKSAWADLPPPSYNKENVMHPIPNMNSHLQFQQNDGHLGGEFPMQTDTRLHHHQVLHSVEQQKHLNEFMQRPLPGGTQLGQTFGGSNLIREEQHYLRPPAINDHQLASSFLPIPPISRGGPVPYPGYNIQPQDRRSFLRDDFPASAGGMPYSQPALHGLQRPTSSNFLSNMGETGGIGPSRSSIPERLSDVGLPKIVVPTHYNPFASTFEQSTSSSKFVSNIFGQEGSTSFGSKYLSSFGYDHRLMGGHGSTKVATSPVSGGTDVAFLVKPDGPLLSARSQELMDRSYPWQQSAEDIVKKQFKREPPVGDQYDPLFDSIEPSSKMSKKLSSIQDQDPVVHDTEIASSVHVPADVEEKNKQKVGPAGVAKIENDEFGETAPDAEVGAVENGSPLPVDLRDWSPAIAIDLPDKVMGEIELDQVRSPGKSKKSKDSRSMKLFKNALADFVKEVLKPSWRQGNMSKEAFKTIVKKTVDKVSGSVSKHQVPKTQAKINHYVESSQRKLTKLVMGYVDKYVKM